MGLMSQTNISVTELSTLQIAKQVGNYGELYETHFGPKTNINIERGLNKLWSQGGLQYAPPIR